MTVSAKRPHASTSEHKVDYTSADVLGRALDTWMLGGLVVDLPMSTEYPCRNAGSPFVGTLYAPFKGPLDLT